MICHGTLSRQELVTPVQYSTAERNTSTEMI
eukprot:IDg13544t1